MNRLPKEKKVKELIRWAVCWMKQGLVQRETNRPELNSGNQEGNGNKAEPGWERNLRLEAEVLLTHVMGCNRTQLYLVDDGPVAPDQADRFVRAVKRRATGYPLQYLTGKQEFMSLEFGVPEGVLIPRSDTEVLVEKAIELLKSRIEENAGRGRADTNGVLKLPVLLVADICTGSGAVGLSIAYYVPAARVLLTDISEKALVVAAQNRDNLNLKERTVILHGNLLQPVIRWLKAGFQNVARRLDMIVANPPYISASGWEQVEPEVQQFEPRLALDGGEDGLDFYRQLVPGAASLLNKGGYLLVEIGYDQGKAVMEIFRQTGDYEELEVLQDYGRRNRVVLGRKKHK